MADNVVPWPGSRGETADDSPERGPDRAAGPSDFEAMIATLPERFRGPARHLATRLRRATPSGPGSETEEDEETGWCSGLEVEEAWAVAESFRRSLLFNKDRGQPDELHFALDRALLSAAVASVAEVSRTHRRVLEDVSHDLRSPLNSILFLADALRAERSGPLTGHQMRQVGVLYTAAVTLVKMVNDLIDFARLGERERIHVANTSFSVEAVISDVRGLLGPLVAHRAVELRTDLLTEGARSGDPQLLSRVLLNLMSNAVQAVDEGGTVSVRVHETRSGDLRTEICDNRLGTDVGHLRSLISQAEAGRLPGETRGWTRGLGLSITARLVKVAGGQIQVASRPGEGTVFTVDLPFRRL